MIFTEVDIKQTLDSIDLKLRPQALIFHPSRMRDVTQLIPDIEERVELLPALDVPEDVMYLVDRKEIEKWTPLPIVHKGEFENV